MRVLLVSANTEVLNMPTMPVGLAQVAAATRAAGHEVSFLDLLFEPEPEAALGRAVSARRPEVVGLSVRNIDDQEMAGPRLLLEKVRPLVEACRAASDATVVLGGAGYGIFPDAALDYLGADLGVRGDGEAAFPRLLERLERGLDPAGLPGVHLRGRPGAARPEWPRELDALAPLETDFAAAYPIGPELWVPVQCRRGCPNGCSYCSTPQIQGRRVRCRSPELVVDQVRRLARAGFDQVYFVDNSFNIPESYGLELCERLARLGAPVRFRAIVYPEAVSPELVSALARAGCAEVALGFESGAPEVLASLGKRFGPDEVRRASSLLEAHGIRRTGFLLLGGPGETRETVELSLAFAESLDLDALRTTVGIRLYPGTPLARQAVDEGLLEPEDDLLRPRFYLAPGLEPWIRERVQPGFRKLRGG